MSALALALHALVGCSGSASTRERRPAVAPSEHAPPSGSESPPASTTAPAPEPTHASGDSRQIDVAGRAPADGTIEVSGSSDLPPATPSTAQPFVRVIDAAVAPVLPAMTECLRPMGAGRWSYHVSVLPSGRMTPRPPQIRAMPAAADRCADALVRGTLVNPPPPVEVPYNIYVTVAP